MALEYINDQSTVPMTKYKAYRALANGSNAAMTAWALADEAMCDIECGIWFLAGSCGDGDSRPADDDRANILSVGKGRIRWLQ